MEEKDYKKLYEDVLERAKDGLKDKNYYLSQSAKEVTEFLFPQLKETEDEKMKRELTRFLINFNNGNYSRPSENEIDSWIKWINKKCGQKPTDEVKPKFNVGDWVRAFSSGNIFKILSVNDGLYRVLCYDGVEANYPIIDIDYDLVPWTIHDAKDGDVLATKKGNPFIYDKDRYNNGLAYYYAGLDVNKELTLKSPHHMLAHFGELCSIFPATKEQRDLLFQKMKEAGYEWDAEKKELMKIEQKHDDSLNEEDYGIDGLWHAQRILEKTLGEVAGYQTDDGILAHKCAIAAVNKLYKQKYSWSEKDEKMLNDILMCGEHHCYLDDGNIAWLKSIKDRVQPQQKQEWSKEDSERILRIHQFIWANRKGDTDEIYQQEQDADWLMSIIPQQNQYDKGYNDGYSAAKYNQWKPTDKQMEDFRMLLDYNIGVFDYAKFMSADSLYDDLKKNLID